MVQFQSGAKAKTRISLLYSGSQEEETEESVSVGV